MSLQKMKLSVDEICSATSEARPLVFAAIRAGHLRTFLVGRRRFAKPADVESWIDFLQRESDAGRPVVYQPRASEKAA
jgi:hypothetical protein